MNRSKCSLELRMLSCVATGWTSGRLTMTMMYVLAVKISMKAEKREFLTSMP